MPPEGTLLVIWLRDRMRRLGEDAKETLAFDGVLLALLRADMAMVIALRGFSLLVPFAEGRSVL
jgi:hypothetical protein